jgi:hypothetical protein
VSRFAFELDIRAFQKDLEDMAAQAPAIMAYALNRALVSGQTAMVRAVTADTGIAAKNVRREIVLDKANLSRPVAALTIAGKRIPLIAFQARGPEPSRGRGKGVSYRLPTGRGHIPNAFIATMMSGHRGVFTRKPGFAKSKRHGEQETRPQLPIQEKRGPSLPHVFEKFVPTFQAAAQESLVKNLAHEIAWAKSKQGQLSLPTGEFPLRPVD